MIIRFLIQRGHWHSSLYLFGSVWRNGIKTNKRKTIRENGTWFCHRYKINTWNHLNWYKITHKMWNMMFYCRSDCIMYAYDFTGCNSMIKMRISWVSFAVAFVHTWISTSSGLVSKMNKENHHHQHHHHVDFYDVVTLRNGKFYSMEMCFCVRGNVWVHFFHSFEFTICLFFFN